MLLSPARAPRGGHESPLNLMLVSDPHSSNLAKFMPAKLAPMVPSASRASPTFVGHNFMDEPSHSPAKSAGTKAAAQLPRSALVQAVVVKRAAAEQASAATGPLKAAKAVQAKAAFCTLSKALEGDDNVPCRLSDGCLLAGSDGCTLAARHKGLCALRQLEDRRNHRPPPSPKLSAKAKVLEAAPHERQALALGFRPPAPSSKRKVVCEVAEVAEDCVSLPDYRACRLADGCLLAERHKGLCLIPVPEGRRNKRAAPPLPSPKRKQQKKTPSLDGTGVMVLGDGILVDEIERIGLKLAGVAIWTTSP